MRQMVLTLVALAGLSGCASTPTPVQAPGADDVALQQAAEVDGQQTVAANLAAGGSKTGGVCEPVVVDDRAKLDPNCVNLVEDLGKRNGRYPALSRPKRELRSMCENTFLPRCRHKY